jgi:hypothetical protein
MTTQKLDLSMFARNANKPASELQNKLELQEINNNINKGRNEMFKKHGVKVNVVECSFTNKEGKSFKVYYFKEVYEYIKHVKNIKFICNVSAISTECDKLEYYIELAKTTKKTLKYDVELSASKIIVI